MFIEFDVESKTASGGNCEVTYNTPFLVIKYPYLFKYKNVRKFRIIIQLLLSHL